MPGRINWDLWLGPAPERPYSENAYAPFKWRGFWDFGTGALGDMACHTANMAFMALKLSTPIAVKTELDGTVGTKCAATRRRARFVTNFLPAATCRR